jgi:hypothetical protein
MRFRLSKRRAPDSSRTDLIAGKIANGILRIQKSWATAMSDLTKKASIRTQWLCFILFVIAAIANCSWMLYRSFNTQGRPSRSNLIERQEMVKPLMDSSRRNNVFDNTAIQDIPSDSIYPKPRIQPQPSKQTQKNKNNEKSIKR